MGFKTFRRIRGWIITGCLLTLLGILGGMVLPAHSVPGDPITVIVRANESYDDFRGRVTQAVYTEINTQFRANPSLTQLDFEVIGQRNDTRATLVQVSVARSQWQVDPTNLTAWVTPQSGGTAALGFTQNQSSTVADSPSDSSPSNPSSPSPETTSGGTVENNSQPNVPAPVVLPSPGVLSRTRYDDGAGDFLAQISPTFDDFGYLRWVDYPVKVYIQPDHSEWRRSIRLAVTEWRRNFPLLEVGSPQRADISIYRTPPIPGIHGEAQPELFVDSDDRLGHRVTIVISEYRTLPQVTTICRHEIGHALGLWGHSPDQQDLMSPSLTSFVAPISAHTINTLKRVYEQPTIMGQVIDVEAFGLEDLRTRLSAALGEDA